MRRSIPGFVFGLATLGWLALFGAPAQAKTTHLYLERLGSAAQAEVLPRTFGLAVDEATHDVLAIPQLGAGILRFNSDGTPAEFPAQGSNALGGLSFNGFAAEDEVAVDSSAASTAGDIYVTQSTSHVIEVFDSEGQHIGQLSGDSEGTFGTEIFSPSTVAVDQAGHLFTTTGGDHGRLYEFTPTGNPPTNADGHSVELVGAKDVAFLAAGAGPTAGWLFGIDFASSTAVKIDSATGVATPLLSTEESDNGWPQALAVDPGTGHVYVVNGREPSVVTEYDAAGVGPATKVSEFTATDSGGFGIQGIAVDGSTGRPYLSKNQFIQVYSPSVTIPDVVTGNATITGDSTASLNGTVNPDGVELKGCFFEYGTAISYGETTPCAESPAEIGTGREPVTVHADLSGLDTETLYHFRLVAFNENDEAEPVKGNDATLKTPSKPAIAAQWAEGVGTASAAVRADINPENAATSFHLEWGTAASYGNETAEREVGDDDSAHGVSVPLGELAPGTTYHYRFVAENHLGKTIGSDHSFTTFRLPSQASPCPNDAFRVGASALLGDCRAYEMVSPVDKNNGDILQMINNPSDPAALLQSAAEGGKLAYSTYRAFGDAVSAPYVVQYIGSRGAGGWSSQAISPPREMPIDPIPALDVEFRAFSSDLCQGWLFQTPNTGPALAAGAIEGYANLYRRTNCGETTYQALNTPSPVGLEDELEPGAFPPDLQGVSADGSTAIFKVEDRLTTDAIPGKYQVYVSTEGKLRLLCILPNGVHFVGGCSAGTSNSTLERIRTASVQNALSEDGSRVYWTAYEGPVEGPGPIYLRLNPSKAQSKLGGGHCTEPARACTIAVSETVSEAPARFYAASADGARALFSIEGSESGSSSLYEFDLATEESTLLAAKVRGVMGASRDLSRVYLVSREDLAPGATGGEPNLYLEEGGTFRFVATVSASDAEPIPSEALPLTPVAYQPRRHVAQVTPDGKQLAFMSTAAPTGYDNRDAKTGEPDAEVYLYDATANGGAGELLCVSCNPSGARPAGRFLRFEAVDAAQRIAAGIPPAESQLYAPRVIAAGGSRVFFNSFDSLSPRDTNGVEDVYEWEAPGTGTCTPAAETYSARNGGCVSLISSGQGPGDSEFVDADEDGNDVFFTTGQSLVGTDPGLVDIYDARVRGGFAEPPPKQPECEGSACQRAGAVPGSPAPGSSASQASGNLRPGKPHCGKGQRRVRRHGKYSCVKKHGKHHRKKHHGKHKHRHHAKGKKGGSK